MNINFITECDMQDIDLEALHSLVETVLAKECQNDRVRVTVLLTGDEVLQELNFKFFGMKPLQTFVMHDVYKNPTIEKDLARLPHHLESALVS